MKKLLILPFLVFTLWSQGLQQGGITLIPSDTDVGTGVVFFRELRANGTNYVALRAPTAITSNIIWILPSADSSGTQCLSSNGSAVLSWSACSAGSSAPFVDTTSIVKGSADGTKELRFEVDGFTTATTRVLTIQNINHTVAGTDINNSFTIDQWPGTNNLYSLGTSSNIWANVYARDLYGGISGTTAGRLLLYHGSTVGSSILSVTTTTGALSFTFDRALIPNAAGTLSVGDSAVPFLNSYSSTHTIRNTSGTATYADLGIIGGGGTLRLGDGSTTKSEMSGTTGAYNLTQPRAKAYRSASLSINDSTNTILDLDAESFDTGTMHDNTTNPSRITVPSNGSGVYLVTGGVWFSPSALGTRQVELKKNGTNVAGVAIAVNSATEYTGIPISVLVEAVVGDYFQMSAYQNSGGALALAVGAPTVFLCAVRLW